MTSRVHMMMIAALVVLTTGCEKGGEFAVSSGTIGGRVIAADDSTPIAGAAVEIGIPSLTSGTESTVTNQNGEFFRRMSWFTNFENPPGIISFEMKISKADYETVQQEGVAFTSEGAYYPLTMTPTGTCTWPAEVSVSPGVSPTFSWIPSCNMWRVIVRADTTGEEHWRLNSFSGNIINPPVHFGNPVPGVSSYTIAPLTPGRLYNISIYRWTGPGPEDGQLVGQGAIRP